MPSADGSEHILTAEELKDIYIRGIGNTAYLGDIVRVLDAIIDRDSGEDATVETLEADIRMLASLIAKNTKEILYLHRLIALLVFELIEQGIEIESKELLNELKTYLNKYNGS